MRALIFAAALAACSSAPPAELPPPELPQRAGVDPIVAARAEGVEIRAVGEDFVLDIFRESRIRLTLTDTGEALEFAKPEPLYPRWNGSIYETANDAHALEITIRNDRRCEQVNRALYPDVVEIELDGRNLAGCGRTL